MIIRKLNERDCEPYRSLFDEAYNEYLQALKLNNPSQYEFEKREKRKVTSERFNFYLEAGSSFVAEEKGKVIGYIVSQTVSFMHGIDKLSWIEYIVVKSEFRRRGIGTALLQRLLDYAKRNGIVRVYSTISPDNAASIRLHKKVGFNVKSWKVASFRSQPEP